MAFRECVVYLEILSLACADDWHDFRRPKKRLRAHPEHAYAVVSEGRDCAPNIGYPIHPARGDTRSSVSLLG